MNVALLRRAAVFSTVAGLGLLLAWMLGGDRRGAAVPKPRFTVVDVPQGTDIPSSHGISGISVVRAEKIVVAPVQDVVLEDGSKVPFRSLVLRGDTEHPLPSPRRDVRRAFLTNPDLRILPVPRTRKEYEAASTAEPTTIGAPEGILDSGPGEATTIHFKGGVKAHSVRDGTPWDYAAEEADSDVRARTLHSPGAVSIVSKDLKVEGRDLDAAEDARTVVLAGGATGSVSSAGGVRIAGGKPGGAVRFRCRGKFRLLPLAAGSGADPGIERWQIVLDEDALVEQDEGNLAARHIEADISRRRGDAEAATVVDEIRGAGDVVLTSRSEGREVRATGQGLRARPQAKGITDVWLDGSPAALIRESRGGREVRTLDVRGTGTARLSFPSDDGPVDASFRGGATAVLLEPPANPGEAPRRRDLRAATLTLAGQKSAGAPTRVRTVTAEGEALLQDGERRAQAKRIEHAPLENGASRTVLDGEVLLSWPAAGAMDPVAALAPAAAGPPAPPAGGAAGTMLLSSPGRVVVEQPPQGDASEGTRFTADGGCVLRRVAEEREVYRLTSATLDARTPPGQRGFDALKASGDARLAGREEPPGTRTYDIRGATLDVRGSPSSPGARTADVGGAAGKPASGAFLGEDGRPFSVTANTLHFDRQTGAFRAEGDVRGKGILPERRDPGSGLPASPGGAADIACGTLDGVLLQGGPAGSTKVQALDAKENVWVRTATEYASGDRLLYDEGKGSLLLTGAPARVTARSEGTPPDLALQDRCESPEILLFIADGRLREARCEGGGLLVRHRLPAAGAGKDAPPAERLESRCRGPLSYAPAETLLRGDVVVIRSWLKDGAFVEKDRLEKADEVHVFHPPAAGGAGRVERAVAESAGGRIEVLSGSAGWHASGVSRADMDVAADRVTMESSAGASRFRIESADAVQSYRRAVYDYKRQIFTEQVGATIEGGGK